MNLEASIWIPTQMPLHMPRTRLRCFIEKWSEWACLSWGSPETKLWVQLVWGGGRRSQEIKVLERGQ